MKYRNLWGGAIVGAFACATHALTLGPARGDVVLGQPIDLTFEVELDPNAEVATSCFRAEVAFSDSKIEPSRVQVAGLAGGSRGKSLVRVWSSAVVDEPVASVALSAGCSNRMIRKYTFLAQLPAGTTSGGVVGAFTPARSLESITAGSSMDRRNGVAANTGVAQITPFDSRSPRREVSPDAAAPSRRSAEGSTRRGVTASAARKPRPATPAPNPAEQSRLVLEPLDAFTLQPLANLKFSSQLASVPEEASPLREEAAAMWAFLNAGPEEILNRAKQVSILENDVKTLRESTSRDQAAVSALQADLASARNERYANALVYGLAGLLALALIAAGIFWRRSRNVASPAEWWSKDGAETGFHASRIMVGDDASGAVRPPGPAFSPSITHVDVDLDDVALTQTSASAPLLRSGHAVDVRQPWSQSISGGISVTHEFEPSNHVPLSPIRPARAINPEELFDIQQHADFFISLGQYDQAIDVLKKHIEEKPETSPLAYLDLLKLYHTLSRIEDYNQLRSVFNRTFSGIVPLFTAFNKQGNGLENYGSVVQSIQDVWFTPRASEVIESAIFREPTTPIESVDLEAFRDLLMLHSVALTVPDMPNIDRGGIRTARAETKVSTPASMPTPKAPLVGAQSATTVGTSESANAQEALSSNPPEVFLPPTSESLAVSPFDNPAPAVIMPSSPSEKMLAPIPSAAVDFELDLDLSDASVSQGNNNSINASDAAALKTTSSSTKPAPLVELSGPIGATAAAAAARASKDDNLIDFDVFDLPDEAEDVKEKGLKKPN